ncbi:MAG: hypothetical protein ORO03_09615 [Alphaproteobacteria bacterium]|nr:hypothetical protein [Alphaproteobacteria bacterium]
MKQVIIDLAQRLREKDMREVEKMNLALTRLSTQSHHDFAPDHALAIAEWLNSIAAIISTIRQTMAGEVQSELNLLERHIRGVQITYSTIAEQAKEPVAVSQSLLRLLAVAFDNAARLIGEWLKWFESPVKPLVFRLSLNPQDRAGLNAVAQEFDLRRSMQ